MKKKLIIIGIVSFMLVFALALTGCNNPTGPRNFGGGGPSAPTGVTATYDSVNKEVHITWNHVSNATYYNIWRSENVNSGYIELGYVNSSYNGTWDEEIVAGHTYYYKVDAENSSGQRSALSAASSAVTIPGSGAPAVPTGVTATYDSANSRVLVQWNTVSNAYWYNIWVSENQYSGFTELGFVTSDYNGTYDYDIVPGHTYYYKVDAESSSNQRSALSAVSNGVTIPGTPSAPTGLNIIERTSNRIKIEWTPVPTAEEYRIYQSTSSYGPYEYLGAITDTGLNNWDLEPNTTYYYQISSWNSSYGESSTRSSISASTTSRGTLSTPTGLNQYANSSTSLSISFNAVSGATGYDIYMSTSYSGPYNYCGYAYALPQGTKIDDLTPNTTYYIRVTAWNSSGESYAAEYTGYTSY